MKLDDAIRRRRMCRDFLDRPVPPETIDRLLDRARRAPSAGNTDGREFVVLEGAVETSVFWAHAADPEWLARPDHPGLLRAPVVVVPYFSEQAYLDRYAEPDKGRSGLADIPAQEWPAPYWLVDAAFSTMLLLLGAVEEQLGALLFRLHGDPDALRIALGVPDGWDAIGAVALGWPADAGTVPPLQARRARRPLAEVVHRGRW